MSGLENELGITSPFCSSTWAKTWERLIGGKEKFG